MKLQEKGQGQDKKGRFTSKIPESEKERVLTMLKEQIDFNDLVKFISDKYHVNAQSATNFINKAMAEEYYKSKLNT